MDKVRDSVIDELLVMRCQAGSRRSFDLLARRWQRRLWQYARSLTGRSDAAWDATQEAWLAIFRRIRTLNDPAWFAPWAYRIVRNKCADHARSAVRHREAIETAGRIAPDGRDPRSADACEDVFEAMKRLPPDMREVLALKYGAELNVVEIGVVLDIPVGTVKSRLHYARSRLKEILHGD